MDDYERILKYIALKPDDAGAYRDGLTVIYERIKNGDVEWHERNRQYRTVLADAMRRQHDRVSMERLYDTYNKSLLIDAPVDFDAYMLYIEKDRDPGKQFYRPRRRVLHPIVSDMMSLVTGDLDLLTISMPPGVGKSALSIFFMTWIGGREPDKPNLAVSHDAGIVRGMYEEILRITNPEGEYRWGDVFPTVKVERTNAKDLRIDMGEPKRFETFQFTSVGAGNAGKLRAAGLLYCDDLCESIEQAMSKERLDKLWTQYNTDLKQRKTGACKELHIATRWSVHDVIGRLEQSEMDSPTGTAKFIRIPALNADGESNFDYPGIHDKFTTEWYRRQRDSMDDVNWRALYMNEPIEREGLLYDPDELRRYFELPDTDPDGIVAVCDTKAKGDDYAFMPILYLYGNDAYVADCICDNGDPGVVEERIAQALTKHRVQMAQFESNSAGWHIAEKVQNRVKELGGRCKITTRPTTANKETKIIVNAPAVKERCLFLDNSAYKVNSDYGRMMNMLTGYTMAGRNKHDDVPDGMAMAVLYLDSMNANRVEIVKRPF